MKKIVLGAVLMAASGAASAVAPGGPNCGWGNMLFEGQSGMVPHFLAITTNGTSGNATFGMTSGTNGCSTDGKLTYGGKAMVNAMLDELFEDVARGEGDALNAVATVFGVAAEDRPVFARVAHENFAVIFPSQDVTADEVIDSIHGMMLADEQLAKYAA